MLCVSQQFKLITLACTVFRNIQMWINALDFLITQVGLSDKCEPHLTTGVSRCPDFPYVLRDTLGP